MSDQESAGSGGVVTVQLESEDFSSDGLQIAKMDGLERLNGLFDFKLDVTLVAGPGLSLDIRASIDPMVGAAAKLVFRHAEQVVREVHGIIAEVDEGVDIRANKANESAAFQLRLVPRAFALSLVEIHEVFVGKTIPEIIEEKLSRAGLTAPDDLEWRLSGNYPTREFVVQYKETDLAFITRLAEHYGLTFFFEHEDGADKLVFVDNQSGFPAIGTFALASGAGHEVIKNLHSKKRVVAATRGVSDYNPVNPPVDLRQQVDVPGGFGGGIVELLTKYKSPEQGNQLAGIRAEQSEAHRVLLRGESGAAALRAGGVLTVSDAPSLEDPTILVGSVRHGIVQQAGLLGTNTAEAYANRFEGTRGATQYRPLFETPVPRVHGVVTAFIEEFQQTGRYAVLDERGRYWVRFDFDSGDHPDKHSLPIRMMQAHAGSFYGVHLPLKPGTEVMVAFLDGDLDRPVIVGAVPNELTQSPVNQSNFQINKLLKTETGIVIEARDVWEPEDNNGIQQKPGGP
ncbi:MAG: type VI secretion system tip protein TssI/VgrG [Polyangiaceae bacterium]